MVGVDWSTSPKRHPYHTHTGFVTLVINLINRINSVNQRCCRHHQCCQHHRLILNISLYCTGSSESRACVRFCTTLRWRYWAKKANKVANITFHKPANQEIGKIKRQVFAFWQVQISIYLVLVNLAKKNHNHGPSDQILTLLATHFFSPNF